MGHFRPGKMGREMIGLFVLCIDFNIKTMAALHRVGRDGLCEMIFGVQML